MEAVRRPEAITVRAVDGSIVKLEHFDALRSTLDVARQYALDGVPDRYVVFTDKKIEEISSMLNFSSSSYFRKILKQHTGKTPREIRKNRGF